jgi:hypothetical protein
MNEGSPDLILALGLTVGAALGLWRSRMHRDERVMPWFAGLLGVLEVAVWVRLAVS